MNWWKVRSSCASQSHVQASGECGAAGGPIAVRVGRVVDGAGQRLEGAAVDVLGGRQGHRLGGPAVVAVAEGEDRRPPGRDARQLDRRLDGLGAGVGQERLPRTAGQDVLEPLVEPQPGLVVQDVLLAVEQLRGLGGDRRRDPRMGVAGVGDADPRRVVEIALAVAGDQPRALAAVDVEVRDPAPDGRDDGVVGQRGWRRARSAAVSTMVRPPRSASAACARRPRAPSASACHETPTSTDGARKMIVPMTLTCTGQRVPDAAVDEDRERVRRART